MGKEKQSLDQELTAEEMQVLNDYNKLQSELNEVKSEIRDVKAQNMNKVKVLDPDKGRKVLKNISDLSLEEAKMALKPLENVDLSSMTAENVQTEEDRELYNMKTTKENLQDHIEKLGKK